MEFFYNAHGFDSNFDPEFDRIGPGEQARLNNAYLHLTWNGRIGMFHPPIFKPAAFPIWQQRISVIMTVWTLSGLFLDPTRHR